MLTADGIEALLRVGDDERPLGESENEHLDFMGQPYILTNYKGTWEVAKEVASGQSGEGVDERRGLGVEQFWKRWWRSPSADRCMRNR